MSDYKVIVRKSDGSCELAEINKNPVVDAGANITVTASTPDATTGLVTYTVAGQAGGAGGSTSTLTGVSATGNAIGTHNSGAPGAVDAVIKETVTSVAVQGAGIRFVDEAGNNTDITMCQMMANVVDNGLVL